MQHRKRAAIYQDRGKAKLSQDNSKKQPAVSNEISDETGQYDARFMLWRKFCADMGVPVETLPSELSADHKEKWEKVKDTQLKADDE